ncbi:hypothetical protein [Nocardioides convexus]|uniref:hypothetical protein n=1 Tax=Nocardioides convexus TaxID=2712224 RepID=UPI0024182046|nr:hypothetical protein [Nocardioides convexus]
MGGRHRRRAAQDAQSSATTTPTAPCGTRLTRTTLDGIGITPLGEPGGPATPVRPNRQGAWDVRSLVSGPDAKLANEAALVDLDGGVTSLWLAADESTDVATTLKDVLLDLAPVVLDAPSATTAVAEAFLALPGDKHPDCNLGVDPLGAMLREIPLAVDDAVAEPADPGAQGPSARPARDRRGRHGRARPRGQRRPGAWAGRSPSARRTCAG